MERVRQIGGTAAAVLLVIGPNAFAKKSSQEVIAKSPLVQCIDKIGLRIGPRSYYRSKLLNNVTVHTEPSAHYGATHIFVQPGNMDRTQAWADYMGDGKLDQVSDSMTERNIRIWEFATDKNKESYQALVAEIMSQCKEGGEASERELVS